MPVMHDSSKQSILGQQNSTRTATAPKTKDPSALSLEDFVDLRQETVDFAAPVPLSVVANLKSNVIELDPVGDGILRIVGLIVDLLEIVSSAKAFGRSDVNACVLQYFQHTLTASLPGDIVACENFVEDFFNGLDELGLLVVGPAVDEVM